MPRALLSPNANLVRFGVLIFVSVTGACGGGDAAKPRLLTPGEVTGLPAGNAQGQAFSGLYVVSGTASPNVCSCRVGSCSDFHFNAWWVLSLSEADGAMTLTRARGDWREQSCTGGIDADGAFWCGAQTGVALFLMEGQISLDGPSLSMSMTTKETVAGDDGSGHIIDCDNQQSATFLSSS